MALFALPAPVLAAGGLTDINPGLTLWTGITFLVLLVVLGKFAWGPIVKMLAERERTIRDAIESAKKERAEAERMLAEQKESLARAQREAAELAKRNAQGATGERSGQAGWRGPSKGGIARFQGRRQDSPVPLAAFARRQ